MLKVFESRTQIGAWREALEWLMEAGESLNVVLVVSNPSAAPSKLEKERIDQFMAKRGQLPLHAVAETIFPGWLYIKRGLGGVFDTYPEEEYPRIRSRNPSSWGTYAFRLVRRKDGNGSHINPLEQMIDKMNTELGTTWSQAVVL